MILEQSKGDIQDNILSVLFEADPDRIREVYESADKIRTENVGDEVHLRGILELSNYCVQKCHYCGMNADRKKLQRYRMTAEEILSGCREMDSAGFRTVVLQSGEDHGISRDWFASIVREIKQSTELAVTVSLGERSVSDLKAWKEAGADRYLLKFETSSETLYNHLHPSAGGWKGRIRLLHQLRDLGYETGVGMMIGLPGTVYRDLVNDLLLLKELDPDMIGLGPYVRHPDTPMGKTLDASLVKKGKKNSGIQNEEIRVPANETVSLKALALARILCPKSNIPVTTSLQTIDPDHGLVAGLKAGGNVIMPNLTPERYKRLYDLYPRQSDDTESARDIFERLRELLATLGRHPAKNTGISKAYRDRQLSGGVEVHS